MLITVIIIIIVGLLLSLMLVYNKLIREIEAVNNSERQIDIQLDRRSKVFDSLINTVKKYMDYEQTTLKQVTALRTQSHASKASGDVKGYRDAENQLSGIVQGLNIQFERYPQLKANENVQQLQEEIVSTENKLSYAKQAFNDSIEIYNAYKKSMFPSMVVKLFSAALDKQFIYWHVDESQKEALENKRVQF